MPFRWKSLALAVAIGLSLAGSWAAVRPGPAAGIESSEPSGVSSTIAFEQIDAAIAALARLAAERPREAEWKVEIGRLYAMRRDWLQARYWYEAALRAHPDDAAALDGLAAIAGHTAR